MPGVKPTWVLLGCGYTGERLLRVLLDMGERVIATRQTESGCDQLKERYPTPFLQCRQYSLGDAFKLPEKAIVLLSTPPGANSPQQEEVFAKIMSESVRVVYLSTTGVYPAMHGESVTEVTPVAPASARGQKRLDVERALLSCHSNTVILRLPSIYGPHRGVHARMQAQNYRLIGKADTFVSRIHVDDLVAAIVLVGTLESLQQSVYVIGDELPTSSREFAEGVASLLGLQKPPTVAPEEVSSEIRTMLGANRRIVPTRLRALGWSPRFPTWVQGVKQAVSEETHDKFNQNSM